MGAFKASAACKVGADFDLLPLAGFDPLPQLATVGYRIVQSYNL